MFTLHPIVDAAAVIYRQLSSQRPKTTHLRYTLFRMNVCLYTQLPMILLMIVALKGQCHQI